MEKDNKKARDDARKEYNDTVRVSARAQTFDKIVSIHLQSLAKFIRKRDPRYKKYLSQQAERSVKQPSGSVTPLGIASRRHAEAVESYVEQDWQKINLGVLHADLEWAAAEGEDTEEWECVACGKSFRSEAAWDSHERSKKHMKEVEILKRQMEEENEDFDLQDGTGSVAKVEEHSLDAPEQDILSFEQSSSEIDEVVSNPHLLVEPPLTSEATQVDKMSKGKKQDKNKIPQTEKQTMENLTRTERKARKLERLDVAPNGSVNVSDIQAMTIPGQSDEKDVKQDQEKLTGLSELSKREKRRARQAKKEEDGDKKEIRVWFFV